MRKLKSTVVTALISGAVIAGCGEAQKSQQAEQSSAAPAVKQTVITVFAAASLTESLSEIGSAYEKKNPGVKVVFNFDSSGTLKRQIEEGAQSDIFISAAPKQMNELEKSGHIVNGSRFDFLENKVVLAVASGNPYTFNTFAELGTKLQNCKIPFAIGNSDVPVGQYSLKIFESLGLKPEELEKAGCLSYGSNVKEVTTQISEGMVSAGIVYATDAVSAGLTAVDTD